MSELAVGTAPSEGQESVTEEKVAHQTTPQRLKVKIDGNEEEVDLEVVARDYQKYKSADKRFQEAAALRKEFGPIADKIKAGDLDSLVEHVGEEKARAWAENYLLKWLEYQEMPEAEKKALRLEQELTATKSKLQQIDEEKNKTLYDQARDQAYQEIDQEISGALKAMGKAPTPRMIARIAETMLASLSDETKPRIDGKRAVEQTLSEFQKDFGEYLDSLEPEELMRVLPKKKLDALRRAQVDEVLSQSPIKSKKRETDEPQTQSKKQKNMTTDDYFKHLERRLG